MIATVDTNGLVTAVIEGTATITATTNDGGLTAESTVTVSVPTTSVTGITLDLSAVTLEEGATQLLIVSILPLDATDKSVVWSSSDPLVATVDPDGLVTAIAEGTATITVTTDDGGFTAESTVTVMPFVDPDECTNRIVMEFFDNVPGFSIADLKNHASFPNTPDSTLDLDEFTIPYNAGDTYGVRVKGLLKAPETGTYYFWITGDDNVELSLSTDANTANKVRIAYHEGFSSWNGWNKYPTQKSVGIDLIEGENYYIEALLNELGGSDNLSVGWRRPSNGDGAFPQQLIQCQDFDTFSGTALIPVTGISGLPSSLTLAEGEISNLIATVSPYDATDKSVVWSSIDPSVATVDTSGSVTAIAEGATVVSVTTNDGGFSAQVALTVIPFVDLNDCTNRLVMEIFDNVSGASIDDLKNHASFPNSPSNTSDLDQFVIPYNAGDAYGVRVKGLLNAPETGTYYFWITGDDNVELSLSTDASSVNKVRIAYHEGFSSWNGWNKYPTQKSIGIDLVAGQTYYIVALMNESSGADYLSVGWRRPSDGDRAVPQELMQCDVFESFVGPALVDVTGVSLIPATVAMNTGDTANLTASISPYDATDKSVAWSSSDTDIATVDAAGQVTAIAEGTATITVTTNDGGFTAESTVTVTPSVDPNDCTNRIVMEFFDNVPGFSIADLKNNASFPNTPDSTLDLEEFTIPYNAGDAYGVRVKGLLKAPETGTYYFWITGDDNVELSLSSDANSANKVRIAYHEGFSSWNGWNKYPTQKSVGINLVEGENYYVEALLNELGGSDNLSVGWRRPSDGDGPVPAQLIQCQDFDTFSGTSSIPVTGISGLPSSQTIAEGELSNLIATVSPYDATDKSAVWSSSDPSIATVDQSGSVTAIAEGVTVISVTTNDGGFIAQTALTVIPFVDPNDCTDRIVMEFFDNVAGSSIDGLKDHPSFPNSPSSTTSLDQFVIPYNVGDNYGVRVKGLLNAPETGTYYFWVTGDNNVELSLSTDASSANKVRIAYHEGFSSWNGWNKYPTQKSIGIGLVAGQTYYIEALMNESSGADYLSVGWSRPSDGDGAIPQQLIPCEAFETFPTSLALRVDLASLTSDMPADFVLSPNPSSTEVLVKVTNLDENAPVVYTVYGSTGKEVIRIVGGIEERLDVRWLAKGRVHYLSTIRCLVIE